MQLRFFAMPLTLLLACGSSGSSGYADPETGSSSSGGTAPGSEGASSGGTSGSSGKGSSGSSASPSSVVGLWNVSGADARGAYTGQAELRVDGGKATFARTVTYTGQTVEDGRTLHWAWLGTLQGALAQDAKQADVMVTLDNRDFVRERAGVVRSISDAPVTVTGHIVLDGTGAKASFVSSAFQITERWENPVAPGQKPILSLARSEITAHAPPSGLDKQTRFATFASFRELPMVAPYTKRPEFETAVHGHLIDTTDAEFYRQNPSALRVINKTIDAVSLDETRSRADAFRKTLGEKARGFDDEILGEFIDPQTGMLLDGGPVGQPKEPHFSAALWTGTYAAAQAMRFFATQEPQAKANFIKVLDGVLKLQEVTSDWKQFARAIRPAKGNPTGGWRAGTGAYAGLEWLEGGNNDMMKGLYLAYIFGHQLLCQGVTGHEDLCTRIRRNARHLSDDINVDRGSDELDSAWLTAVVSPALDAISYRAKAEATWTAQKAVIKATPATYTQGIADWSGLNLGFASNLFHLLLAERLDLGGDAKAAYTGLVADGFDALSEQRLPLWNLLQGAFPKGAANAAAIADAKARLQEMPFPKPMHVVDLRVNPWFCMSPYPSLPWKNDWTTTDRTQSLRTVPLYMAPLDLYAFRVNMQYKGGSADVKAPAPEYLIAYWFGRRYGLISAND